jgi:cell division transport system permease protein
MAKAAPYRPDTSGRADFLGLRGTTGGRTLPLLVAAMAFLAALALAGAIGAATLAARWRDGASATLTIQVPQPDLPIPVLPVAGQRDGPEITRLARVMALLEAAPAVATARALEAAELTELLRPWLGTAGDSPGLALPGVIEVHLRPGAETGDALGQLATALDATVSGTVTESHGVWVARLSGLARSLQACAWLILALVVGVSCAVVVVATQAGLAARRDAIDIVHGLGATDGRIAGAFAGRAARLAGLGGMIGIVAALPVLMGFSELVRPFTGTTPTSPLDMLPLPLWEGLPCLAVGAALIGFLTAQTTVRRWLRRRL